MLAIVAHWISDDWIYHERVIDFQEIVGKHNGQNLATHFIESLNGLGILHKVLIYYHFIKVLIRHCC